eukprot:2492991-Amphidinium_carterae.1
MTLGPVKSSMHGNAIFAFAFGSKRVGLLMDLIRLLASNFEDTWSKVLFKTHAPKADHNNVVPTIIIITIINTDSSGFDWVYLR